MFSRLDDCAIRTKIQLTFAVVMLVACIMGGVGIYNLHALDKKSTEITENWLIMTDASHRMYEDSANMRFDAYKYTHVTDKAVLDKCLKDTMMHQEGLKVEVLSTDAVWFGVTYKEDKAYVAGELKKLHDKGDYPPAL